VGLLLVGRDACTMAGPAAAGTSSRDKHDLKLNNIA
jgi:hypothetical protein